mmetsp:Transcript_9951/g.25290  ORF Transcript_9951/g.25290 Transcript_9951/m.25290 type:complete len:126 (+) Transcript_9951:3-380(+)
MHNFSNPFVVFAADMSTAESSIYFIANHFKVIDGRVQNATVYGRYCDSWQMCDDGKFRISYRKLLYDFQGDDWNKAIEAAKNNADLSHKPSVARHENLGTRDKADYDYAHIDFKTATPLAAAAQA